MDRERTVAQSFRSLNSIVNSIQRQMFYIFCCPLSSPQPVSHNFPYSVKFPVTFLMGNILQTQQHGRAECPVSNAMVLCKTECRTSPTDL